ncbi:hypothetical protein JHK85_028212 [Glycine max]|nr:hypothetical protein JHK85_028212 [Glycine max]
MDVSYLARGNGWKKLIVYMMQDYLLDEDDNLEGGKTLLKTQFTTFAFKQESTMYNYHEKGRAPDLESVLADFMTYQATFKGDSYSMQQQETQFENGYSLADY